MSCEIGGVEDKGVAETAGVEERKVHDGVVGSGVGGVVGGGGEMERGLRGGGADAACAGGGGDGVGFFGEGACGGGGWRRGEMRVFGGVFFVLLLAGGRGDGVVCWAGRCRRRRRRGCCRVSVFVVARRDGVVRCHAVGMCDGGPVGGLSGAGRRRGKGFGSGAERRARWEGGEFDRSRVGRGMAGISGGWWRLRKMGRVVGCHN